MRKEITCITWGREESVVNQLNSWIKNGHDINTAFIKIVHSGAFYTIFYDSDLDDLAKDVVYYDRQFSTI